MIVSIPDLCDPIYFVISLSMRGALKLHKYVVVNQACLIFLRRDVSGKYRSDTLSKKIYKFKL